MTFPCKVSLVLIAYNQEAFIEEACISALSQESEPIEIILSDDHSTDRTFQIMQDLVQKYTGPHEVILRQTEKNVGLVEHINQVVELSSGEVIIYAAGDDISVPNRVSRTMEYFQQEDKRPLIVHSSVREIDAQSRELDICLPPIVKKSISCEKMAQKYSLIIGATCAWHRSIWDLFGPLKYQQSYEDLIMAFRACMLGGRESLVYCSEPLVYYRVSAGAISQGGRNKPKDREGRRAFELKRLRTHFAVFQQRLDDAKKIGATHLIRVLEQEEKNIQMMQMVYEKEVSIRHLTLFAIKNNTIQALFEALLKRFRRM